LKEIKLNTVNSPKEFSAASGISETNSFTDEPEYSRQFAGHLGNPG